jgi:hypothetical protein
VRVARRAARLRLPWGIVRLWNHRRRDRTRRGAVISRGNSNGVEGGMSRFSKPGPAGRSPGSRQLGSDVNTGAETARLGRKVTEACAEYLALLQRMVAQFEVRRSIAA